MSTTYRVGYLVGSLSSTSINRALSLALKRLGAQAGLELTEIPIPPLPFYSADMDGEYPEVANAFKAAIADADAVLIVTPEYNRSVPGVLKNALDFASRPYGENAFQGKPSAVIGTSIGAARHGRRAAAPAQHPVVPGVARALAARGVHPDHRGSHLPRGRDLERRHGGVPRRLAPGVPRAHRQ